MTKRKNESVFLKKKKKRIQKGNAQKIKIIIIKKVNKKKYIWKIS